MKLTDEEANFLYGDLPINESVMTKAVPCDKLKRLLDLRVFLRDIAEAKPGNFRKNGHALNLEETLDAIKEIARAGLNTLGENGYPKSGVK
jgi:hypothetical protein